MKIDIHHASPIPETYRAARVSSMFNVEGDADFRLTVEADLSARPRQVGLIVGPSGSGKTSLGRALFGRELDAETQSGIVWRTGSASLGAAPIGSHRRSMASRSLWPTGGGSRSASRSYRGRAPCIFGSERWPR